MLSLLVVSFSIRRERGLPVSGTQEALRARMEKPAMMIVRLHKLAARQPAVHDLRTISELMVACDVASSGRVEPVEHDLRQAWQAANFNLKSDAWVIVTNTQQIVGYAEVRRGEKDEQGQLSAAIYVHPNYRSRGIGTLLTWLLENRARQIAADLPEHMRV